MIPLSRILAGQRHPPVVYFARVGTNVKIGTTTNLKQRMSSMYVPLENVLAVVPGGTKEESAFHRRFRASRVKDAPGRELFHLDREMRDFLHLGPESQGDMLMVMAARMETLERHLGVTQSSPLPVVDGFVPLARGVPPQAMQVLWQVLAAPGGTTAARAGIAIGVSKTVAFEYLSALRAQNMAVLTGVGRASRWVRATPPEGLEP